jgi:endoglucanase
MRGANLGNYLEAPAGQNWGQTYNATDFANIKTEGFDHVRIPARWNDYTGAAPNYTINESFAQKVDAIVNGALAQGLGALVNIHHFDEFTTDPAANTNKFYKIWEQIAARYASKSGLVAFELLNEPKDAATTTLLNPIYAEAIRRIRITNPNRTIFIGPGQFNSIAELTALRLPAGDTNLIVTVHTYDPFLFTHQGATWTGDTTATTGIIYPGPPPVPITAKAPANAIAWVVDWISRYNTLPTAQNPSSKSAFEGALELAKTWSDYYGRPIHIGEFGAYERADATSRANFYRDMRETADRLGLAWAVWDWKAGFKYWDTTRNAPVPGMREALFPRPVLKSVAPGRVETQSAVGKRLRVLRTENLAPAATWQVILDQPLTSPSLDYVDSTPPAVQAFYIVDWIK